MLLEGLLGAAVDAAFNPPAATAVAALGPATVVATGARCPEDMVWVQGTHYENVQRLCIDYRDGHCFAFFPDLLLREPRATPVDVCMDRFEWPNHQGILPDVMMTFAEAEQSCAAVGKRLCTEFEWELGCEGPATLAFSYGLAVDASRCHTDRMYRAYDGAKLASEHEKTRSDETVRLYQAARCGEHASCQSAFGAYDLVGNVEEWVSTSRPEWPYRSSLKGGYWSKPWAGCRGTNERHGPLFRFYQIGFRCCRAPYPKADDVVPPAPSVQSVG